MTYCNWCMLESDTDDVCAWCKRPLKAKAVYSQARNDLHFLKEQDDDVDSFPIAAVLGGICFLAIVVFAVFSFTRPKDQAQESDPSHWTLAKTDASQPAASGPAATHAFANSANSGERSAFGAPPPVGNFPQPTSPNLPTTNAPQRTPPAIAPGSGQAWAWNKLDTWEAIPVNAARLYFESADFKFVNDKGGVPRLVGDVVIINDTYDNVDNARLWLTVNNTSYPLLRYDGTINAPLVLPAFAIASKSPLTCHVFARDFDGRTKGQGKRKLTLAAFLSGQPVKIQSDING